MGDEKHRCTGRHPGLDGRRQPLEGVVDERAHNGAGLPLAHVSVGELSQPHVRDRYRPDRLARRGPDDEGQQTLGRDRHVDDERVATEATDPRLHGRDVDILLSADRGSAGTEGIENPAPFVALERGPPTDDVTGRCQELGQKAVWHRVAVEDAGPLVGRHPRP